MQTQSPCLKEVSQVFLQGCFPSPMSESQEKVSKSSSTIAASRRHFAETTTFSIFPNTQFTNHESLPSLRESFADFSKAYPQYSDTNKVDQIRAREYSHLSVNNHTCLDYIGIGLFSYSQLQKQESSKLASSSHHLPPATSPQQPHIPFFAVSFKAGSLKTELLHGGHESELESAMKKRIMKFLKISENDYSMVFTANRTSAFKLLAESYPFQSSNKLLTVYDYESEAVQGMINSSEKKGARIMSAEFSWPRFRIHSEKLKKMLVGKRNKKSKRGLFVFPLHSRVTGARYPYLWMNIAQENGWHILIDACALGPKDMNSFGLSLIRPDFLICSFYKIFGENPSGFGCLFVKKSTIPVLESSASTGMVNLAPAANLFQSLEASSAANGHQLQQALVSFTGPITAAGKQPLRMEKGETSEIQNAESALKQKESATSTSSESGKSADVSQQGTAITNDQTSLDIECKGLDQVDSLGLVMISSRTRCLINWLVNALLKLKHPNTEGIALVRIYGPKIKFDRGPALAFNVFDWKGAKVEPVLVQKLADRHNISLSYGLLHHIWFADKYQDDKNKVIGTKAVDWKSNAEDKSKDKTDPGITVVTAALGFLTNFEDIYRFWVFVAQFLDADFVEKARWRYTALNQKTVEV